MEKKRDRQNLDFILMNTNVSIDQKNTSIASYIAKYWKFRALLGYEMLKYRLFFYNGKYWSDKADAIIFQVCRWIDPDIKDSRIREIRSKIYSFGYGTKDQVIIDPKDFFINEKYIALNNCLLDTSVGKPVKYDYRKYVIHHIDIDFDPIASSPNFDKFLSQVVTDNNDKLIWEWFGFCLQPGYTIPTVMFLEGKGSNGKSLLLDILANFIGSENCSSVALRDFGTSRFRTSELIGSMVNIAGDIDRKALRNTSMLKTITGGEPVLLEKKGQNPVRYKVESKLVFSANEIPASLDDQSWGFVRRQMIINFPNRFKENSQMYKKIFSSCTTKKEKSGILNNAIKNLMNLTKRGRFNLPENPVERMKSYLLKISATTAFIKEGLNLTDPNAMTSLSEVYTEYKKYAIQRKQRIDSNIAFGRAMAAQGIQKTRRTYRGKQQNVYEGVKLVDFDSLKKAENLKKTIDEEELREINTKKALRKRDVERGWKPAKTKEEKRWRKDYIKKKNGGKIQ